METITQEQYLNAASIIETYHKQLLNQVVEICKTEEFLNNLNASPAPHVLLIDAGMSVRLYNALKHNCNEIGLCDTGSEFGWWNKFGSVTTNDLHKINLDELRKCRNCGKSTIAELKALCIKYGQKMKNDQD